MSGIGTIMWKEWREFLWPGKPSWHLIGFVAMAVVFGLLGGLNAAGPLGLVFGLVFTVMMPIMAVISLTAESFAGERERHTLETLLASHLRDIDILYGKMLAIAAMGGTFAVLGAFVNFGTAVAIGVDGATLGILALAMLGAFAAGAVFASILLPVGVLISLRSATVKGANQAIAFLVFPLFLLPGLIGSGGASLLGAGTVMVLGIGLSALLLLVGPLALWGAHRAFRRERLILVR